LEDLGDDNMKANYYGIQNLKRVMSGLKDWAVQPNRDYAGLRRMYNQVISQYVRYIMHVTNNIGENRYITAKKQGQPGPVLQFIPKHVQKRALQFIARELFDTPDWLYNKEIFALVGGPGEYSSLSPQKIALDWLVNFNNYAGMSFAEMQQPNDAYTYDEFLVDMEAEIWKELKTVKPISFARRNLQKVYIERLLAILPPEPIKESYVLDYYPLLNKHMQGIISQINQVLSGYKDEASRWHLVEVKKRLQQGLHFSRFPQGNFITTATQPATGFNGFSSEKENGSYSGSLLECTVSPGKEKIYPSCWYPYSIDFLH
jgi:hypothetical protein